MRNRSGTGRTAHPEVFVRSIEPATEAASPVDRFDAVDAAEDAGDPVDHLDRHTVIVFIGDRVCLVEEALDLRVMLADLDFYISTGSVSVG